MLLKNTPVAAKATACGPDGWTPMHELIFSQRSRCLGVRRIHTPNVERNDCVAKEMVMKLVAAGASVNAVEKEGNRSCFMLALQSGNTTIVQTMIDTGTDLCTNAQHTWKSTAVYTGRRSIVDAINKIGKDQKKRVMRGLY
jgi:hypothetical protein